MSTITLPSRPGRHGSGAVDAGGVRGSGAEPARRLRSALEEEDEDLYGDDDVSELDEDDELDVEVDEDDLDEDDDFGSEGEL
jgi:hypothetical protein